MDDLDSFHILVFSIIARLQHYNISKISRSILTSHWPLYATTSKSVSSCCGQVGWVQITTSTFPKKKTSCMIRDQVTETYKVLIYVAMIGSWVTTVVRSPHSTAPIVAHSQSRWIRASNLGPKSTPRLCAQSQQFYSSSSFFFDSSIITHYLVNVGN